MSKEKLKPLRNHGSWIRRVFDLQVASTYRGILPIVRRVTSDRISGKVVDVGCGDRPYRTLFPSTWEYLGIDTQDAETNFDYKDAEVIYYDGVTFPIDNESVDFVFHSEVIEHIYDTRHFLSECSRVLKKDGKLCFTVPFQARWHYVPWDYWRFTPTSLKNLLEEAGFENIKVTPRSRDICVAAYKVLTIGYRLLLSKSIWRMFIAVILAPIWGLALLIGQISLHLDIGTEEDCLGYIVYAEKGKENSDLK